MLNLVLFGPPGAGKGTQSGNLIQKYNLVHLSTGDLLRSQIEAGTELGLRAQQFMNQGLLVPDEVVIGMIDYKLHEQAALVSTTGATPLAGTPAENRSVGGFIFDGFPRTVPQAEALDRLLAQNGTQISTMVALVVDDEEMIRRLLKRGETSGRPDDQDEVLIRRRVTEYNDKTRPVADFYHQQGKYVAVNGIGRVEDIFEAICASIFPSGATAH